MLQAFMHTHSCTHQFTTCCRKYLTPPTLTTMDTITLHTNPGATGALYAIVACAIIVVAGAVRVIVPVNHRKTTTQPTMKEVIASVVLAVISVACVVAGAYTVKQPPRFSSNHDIIQACLHTGYSCMPEGEHVTEGTPLHVTGKLGDYDVTKTEFHGNIMTITITPHEKEPHHDDTDHDTTEISDGTTV